MPTSLYFDIGNTNTKIGILSGDGSMNSYILPSDDRQTSDQFGFALLSILENSETNKNSIIFCIGSSVVPSVASMIDKACRRYLDKKLYLVPHDIPIPLENHYARPYEVGSDRLVGAYAARRLFSEAHSIISVDFGTATTFDCVEGNAYLGGLICPGIFSSAAALATKTAKLPQISLEIEGTILKPGSSTATSINHGFIFGFASMAEGLCKRLASSMKSPVLVVGTGGFAKAIEKVTNCFDQVRPDLLLEGLRILSNEHRL